MCPGEERSQLTELQFDGSDVPSAMSTKVWRIHFQQDSVKIHDKDQGKTLTWNIRQLSCFNIVKQIQFVGFTNLHDGKMCYPVLEEITETDNVILEESHVFTEPGIEIRDDTKAMHLMTNILIIAGVIVIVILMSIIGVIRQCRQCVMRVLCLDRCFRSSYNVSALEDRRMFESQAATHSTNASRNSDSSNTSSILQY